MLSLIALLLFLAHHGVFAQEWSPALYVYNDQEQTPQCMHAMKEIHKLQLKGTEAVLDIGCGDGAISSYIAQKFLPCGTMHGIDISETMIAAAQKNSHSLHVTFEQASLLEYSPSALYDRIVCFWVLYLFEDYCAALERVVSCLKPGGKALICHIIAPGTPFFQLFKKNIEPQKLPITLPTLDTVLSAIKSCAVTIDYLEIKYNYDTFAHFNAFVTSMRKIPFFTLLPPEKEASFEQELLKYYQPAPDGFTYDYSQVICMVLQKV
ncbi:MAG: methyltransferase domain-containing protein [Candidatus Babeliales bacterium]